MVPFASIYSGSAVCCFEVVIVKRSIGDKGNNQVVGC